MIVDADPTGNTCHTALFNIGGPTTTSRSWNVLITHYSCGDTDSSGYVYFIYIVHTISKKFHKFALGEFLAISFH